MSAADFVSGKRSASRAKGKGDCVGGVGRHLVPIAVAALFLLPVSAPAGKEGVDRVLVRVLLYGLKGDIEVKGKRFTATMPAFADLNDGDAAAVLNRILTNWGNDKLLPKDHKAIAPGEVKALRGEKLTPEQVYAIREKLGLK